MTDRAMRLSLLGLRGDKGRDPEVTGLAIDSRQVRPGHLFAALPGSVTHGGEFIQYALRQGAGAILTDRKGAEIAAAELAGSDAVLVVAEDPRAALAGAAALWFAAQPETMVGVTGTSGKTSVAALPARSGRRWGTRRSALAPWACRATIRQSLPIPRPIP